MSVESNGSAIKMSDVVVNKGSLEDEAVLSIESQSPERVESPQEIHKVYASFLIFLAKEFLAYLIPAKKTQNLNFFRVQTDLISFRCLYNF